MIVNVSYRKGFSSKVPVQEAHGELESIRLKSGRLTPALVVEAARPKKAPLHEHFEWNNSAAAEAWRQHQARNLIGAIRVTMKPTDAPVRQYVSVAVVEEGKNEKREYRPIQEAFAKEDERQQVLRRAFSELKRLRREYAALKELAEVFEAVDRLELPDVAA